MPWVKGHTHTPETRAKISGAMSGRPKTIKHKKAISRAMQRSWDERRDATDGSISE
jgi:hypothetical protein